MLWLTKQFGPASQFAFYIGIVTKQLPTPWLGLIIIKYNGFLEAFQHCCNETPGFIFFIQPLSVHS